MEHAQCLFPEDVCSVFKIRPLHDFVHGAPELLKNALYAMLDMQRWALTSVAVLEEEQHF